MVYRPQTVTHTGTNRVWHSATTLIEANALPLSQTANCQVNPRGKCRRLEKRGIVGADRERGGTAAWDREHSTSWTALMAGEARFGCVGCNLQNEANTQCTLQEMVSTPQYRLKTRQKLTFGTCGLNSTARWIASTAFISGALRPRLDATSTENLYRYDSTLSQHLTHKHQQKTYTGMTANSHSISHININRKPIHFKHLQKTYTGMTANSHSISHINIYKKPIQVWQQTVTASHT